ncbi:hypothetical protein B8V81_0367 [Paenibacillus pasadenensis]|uniref:Uncharacterized protein n=1 Tax=Paenibacillus pasadenensis TaxID=217090 RepID=A0A2N5ND13_9BACL|nr:hypothetical protein B8V81_0367 [Paenibacillus pasadenensis]
MVVGHGNTSSFTLEMRFRPHAAAGRPVGEAIRFAAGSAGSRAGTALYQISQNKAQNLARTR